MKNKNVSVSIGIPAYNEAANIVYLIRDLLLQKQNKFTLKHIYVYADGCSDKTGDAVRNIKNKKIVLFNVKKRKGLAAGQNYICKYTKEDILVLLNADTRIVDKQFLSKLIRPIRTNKAELTSSKIKESNPKGLIAKSLYMSMRLKSDIVDTYNCGNNVYTCHGLARAFKKSLYKKINFHRSIGEDAYSYFYCITKGYRYAYVPSATIFYKLPTSFVDHEKQSIRFIQSQNIMEKVFGKNAIAQAYILPKLHFLKSFFSYFFTYPLEIGIYVVITMVVKIKAKKASHIGDTWDIAKSSKMLTYAK